MSIEAAVLGTISAAVTPVVMISACGSLTLGVNNRQQNLTTQIREAAKESRAHDVSIERQKQLREQIVIWHRRFYYSYCASCALYGAIVCFLFTTLGILWAQRRLSISPTWVLSLFEAGLALMLLASLCVVTEVALSRRTLGIEIRDLELPLRRFGFRRREEDEEVEEHEVG